MTEPGDGLFPNPLGEQTVLDFPAAEPVEQEESVSPLDLPQDFTSASSFQVRDKLQKLVKDDLLGPWDGETEQSRQRAMGPRERYLVGMLGPSISRSPLWTTPT